MFKLKIHDITLKKMGSHTSVYLEYKKGAYSKVSVTNIMKIHYEMESHLPMNIKLCLH